MLNNLKVLQLQVKKTRCTTLKGAWYSRLDSHLLSQGFNRSLNEPTLYFKRQADGMLIMISVYVDDLMITGENPLAVQEVKNEMLKVFEMSDLGEIKFFLVMEISQSC